MAFSAVCWRGFACWQVVRPIVWEQDEARKTGALGYTVLHPDEDTRQSYDCIVDVSGAAILDKLIGKLSPGGELILGGFYSEPIQFAFPPAFMREARIRVAAQWSPSDLKSVAALVTEKRLSLEELVTHQVPADRAEAAYRQAFEDSSCLKMLLDWRPRS